MQEYENLGRIYEAQIIEPHEAVQMVSDHFNGTTPQTQTTTTNASGAEGGPDETAQNGYENCIFTVQLVSGVWQLNVYQPEQSMEMVLQVSLPNPDGPFYSIVIQDGTMCLQSSDTADPTPCATMVADLVQAESASGNLPAGVAVPHPDDEVGF